MFMKALLILVTLGTIGAAPAFAQRSSTACHGAHAAHQQRLPAAAPQVPDSYYQRFPHIWTG
jgi:hypothetical protein